MIIILFSRKVMRERSYYVIPEIILTNNENAITKFLTCKAIARSRNRLLDLSDLSEMRIVKN